MRVWVTIAAVEKGTSITYSERVSVALVIKHAKRMLDSSMASLAVHYFSTFSHKRHDFGRKKVTEHKMCVLIFSTTFVLNVFHSKN